MPNEPVNFLLVDDLEPNLLALAALLKQDELNLLQAQSAAEALELLLVHEVALAIIDVQMPETDGFELAELMRGAERTRRVPIIFVTAGVADAQRRFRGYELGAVDFLYKPIDPHVLRSKAHVFLQLARQRNELNAVARQREVLLQQQAKAEQAARESEAHTRRVLDDLFAFVGVLATNGTLLQANRAPLQAAGLEAADVVGKPFWECYWWNFSPEVQKQLQDSVLRAGRGELVRYDASVRVAGNARKWIDFQVAPLRDSEGRITHLIACAMDITARKDAEAALMRAQGELRRYATDLERMVAERTEKLHQTVAELEAFSYSIAHDMRAPLRSMKGFSDALLEEYAETLDETGRAYLERIGSSAIRMDKLILDVLNYSQLLRSSVATEPVNLGALLDEIVDTYPMLREKNACIQIQAGIPPVEGNEAMLTQVFSNLLGNAVKFVPEEVSPAIRVWSETRDDRVRIFVRDNGIGIRSDQHEKIFAMFHRVHGAYEGTGIGLAVVKKAVQRMGGNVGLQSAPGQGSTFWVEFPAARSAPVLQAQSAGC